MSRSNRLSYLAGFLGLLLLISGNWGAVAETHDKVITLEIQDRTGKDQDRPDTATTPATSEQDKQQPSTYKPDCDEPKNAVEADLCEQGRMAQAAEDLLDRSDTQIRLSKWEIGGLLLTLVFTCMAALAAVIAAKAASVSVATAKETAKQELRAYLVMKDCKLRYVNHQPIATVTFINAGQTPARNAMMVGVIHVITRPTTFLIATFHENVSKGTVGHDRSMLLDARKKTKMTVKENDGLKTGTHTLVVHGDIEYTDIFGDVWVQQYEFCTGGKYGKAVRRGLLSVSTKDLQEHKKT